MQERDQTLELIIDNKGWKMELETDNDDGGRSKLWLESQGEELNVTFKILARSWHSGRRFE